MSKTARVLSGALLVLGLTACSSGGSDVPPPPSGAPTSGQSPTSDPGEAAPTGYAATDPAKMEAEVKAAMRSLTSVRLKGSVESSTDTVQVDVVATTSGACSGELITHGTEKDHFISTGPKDFYVSGNKAFWVKQAGEQDGAYIAKSLGDKYALIPSLRPGFELVCDLDSLVERTFRDSTHEASGAAESGTYEGQAAVKLAAPSGEAVWIAEEAPHYILALEGAGGSSTLTFSEFDSAKPEAKPKDFLRLS